MPTDWQLNWEKSELKEIKKLMRCVKYKKNQIENERIELDYLGLWNYIILFYDNV